MSEHLQLDELGHFLRARRAALTPAQAGVAVDGTQRKVKGLRREEVAQLAMISLDYYVRLEQGRIQPSAPVLTELARALNLSDDQTAYLFSLAGKPGPTQAVSTTLVEPYLQRLLDDLDQTPAFVIGRRTQVLAWNRCGSALLGDFAKVPEQRRQFLRILFTDPAMRSLYDDWDGIGRLTIAQLRMDAARYPDDPELEALVREISELDDDFRRWWGEHDAAFRHAGTKILHHPVVGALELDWNVLSAPNHPDQQLLVWTAAPGSPSAAALRQLSELG